MRLIVRAVCNRDQTGDGGVFFARQRPLSLNAMVGYTGCRLSAEIQILSGISACSSPLKLLNWYDQVLVMPNKKQLSAHGALPWAMILHPFGVLRLTITTGASAGNCQGFSGPT